MSRRVQELFQLTGKIALITGGSRGIGREMAEGLGEAGARVVITARKINEVSETVAQLRDAGIDCYGYRLDVSQPEAVREVMGKVGGEVGHPDILVNNAGTSWGAPATEMGLDKWHKVMDTNATATFQLCQEVFPTMVERGWGRIINIASSAALVGVDPHVLASAGYHASKGAVVSLTRALAVEWAKTGITVNAVCPGWFPTKMTRPLLETKADAVLSSIPMGRIAREGEIKGTILYLASDASSYMTGHTLVLDGGLTIW